MKTLVALLSVQVALLTGTAYQNDIHLLGVIEESGIFKITCFSCLKPYEESADFYINDVQVDTVRYSDGKCYHKRKVCNPIECTCSKEGDNFTLSIKSDLSYMNFSCEMRSKDEATSKISVLTAHLIFNDTEFIPEMQKSSTIDFNEDTHTKIGTTDVNVIVSGDGQKNNKTFNVVGWILVVFVALVISVLTCVFPKTPGKISNWISDCIRIQKYKDDLLPLDDYFDCATCSEIVTCALCVDCRGYYCDTCCVYHRKMNPHHIMFPKQQIAVNQRKVNCNKCTKTAERFCTRCWEPFCTLCSSKGHCTNKNIIIIYQAPSVPKGHKSGDVQDFKLIPLYNVSLKDDNNPIRVCGLAFLLDETVVVIDGNNYKLIVFKSKEEQRLANNELSNEPNAITAVTGNEFAVTYPYQRYIQLYKLTVDPKQSAYRVSSLKTINTPGKPFSIAYNQGIFAVEIGEREDGRIVIIDIKTKIIMKTIECHFAFFTGHTIRLALNLNCIFVSAMGKKIVSCMDFDGKILWHLSVPGPRSIIVSEDYSSSGKIILASKRCNAIYELKKERDYHEFIKATDKINSPRYMAYHSDTNTICVLVGNDRSHKDELAFFKFKNAESEVFSSPSDNMAHNLMDW